MPAAPTFVLRDVERRFGRRVALSGVNLEIAAGERIALIGPSGSGKSTLLWLLLAALRASKGSVEVDGQAIADMSPQAIRAHRRRCGLIDQSTRPIPRLSVHANLIAGRVPTWPWWRTLTSTLWPLEREAMRALLDEVGLGERQWDRADQLSGGEQQRVAIARALASKPAVVLADEPTAALDPSTAAEVIALLARASQRGGASTLVVSTHRVSQVHALVDRVIGLREGRVVFDEPVGAIDDARLDALYEGSRERV